MRVLSTVLNQAVAVTQALLGIAVNTVGAIKKRLADLAKVAMDPFARSRVQRERQRYEARQADIDNEKREILNQAERDDWGDEWPDWAMDRYGDLDRKSEEIAQKLGPRKSIEVAPDDYHVVVVDREHMHRLEWFRGQTTDKRCRKCGLPMILQIPRKQARDRRPRYFWGCPGWYLSCSDRRRCTHAEPVTEADLGTLLRCDNEALEMNRDEMCSKALDRTVSRKIGEDLDGLRHQAFRAYRCPIHDLGMVLHKKPKPKGPLDVWYLKCPSPLPHNRGSGCSQTRPLNTVAQVLAVRQFGTGRIF